MLQVLYLYDYYRAFMTWVSSYSISGAASIVVIYANYVPAWYTIDGIKSKSETLCPFSWQQVGYSMDWDTLIRTSALTP